jgi:hypothetical protein
VDRFADGQVERLAQRSAVRNRSYFRHCRSAPPAELMSVQVFRYPAS